MPPNRPPRPNPSDEEDDRTPSIGIETPEWDALEQSRTVRLDEDYQ